MVTTFNSFLSPVIEAPDVEAVLVVVRHQSAKRLYSSIPEGRASLSIFCGKSTPQATVAQAASEYLHQLRDALPRSASLTVLASRDFAPWLQDSHFFHALFGAAGLGEGSGSTEARVKVAGGAVDAIAPPDGHGQPPSGFSFRIGPEDGFGWTETRAKGIEESDLADSGDARSSLTLLMPPLGPDWSALRVTLPLANTVFTTGKVSTTVSGTWRTGGSRQGWTWSHAQHGTDDAQELTISLRAPAHSTSTLSSPLAAIKGIRLRKVVSGLGNILRQVEVDGKTCSASAELEAAIPEMLKDMEHPGPMPVWALIVPEAAVDSVLKQVEESFGLRNSLGVDGAVANVPLFKDGALTKLVAAGCRLHRVLSGGGGWGAKRGLLSLDPQTAHTSHGNEDVESFISAFKGEGGGKSGVSPGDYVLYLVHGKPSEERRQSAGQPGGGLYLGTAPLGFEDAGARWPDALQVVPGHFGAVTAGGLFLQSRYGGGAPDAAGGTKAIQSKLDVPESYVYAP